VIVPAKYDDITAFQNGYARFMVNAFEEGEYWGLININQKVILKPIYEDISDVNEGLISYEIGSKWGLMTITGKKVLPPKYD